MRLKGKVRVRETMQMTATAAIYFNKMLKTPALASTSQEGTCMGS
jgi:hypothetical protein